MTKTCCLDCITDCHEVNCRTEPLVSWCKQKPNERIDADILAKWLCQRRESQRLEESLEAEYPKTNKDVCNGNCKNFKPKQEKVKIES